MGFAHCIRPLSAWGIGIRPPFASLSGTGCPKGHPTRGALAPQERPSGPAPSNHGQVFFSSAVMVRSARDDRCRAIELLDQDEMRELVWQRQRPQAQAVVGGGEARWVVAVG